MKKVIILILLFVISLNIVFADTSVNENISEELKIDDILDSLNKYVGEEFNLSDFKEELLNGDGINYGVIGNFLLNNLFKETFVIIKSSIQILIIMIVIAIINSLELDNGSSVITVSSFVGFILVVGIISKNYAAILKEFVSLIDNLTSIMEVVSPFLLSMLIATGEIATSGIISPLILFVTTLIGTIISYIVVPLFTLSYCFNVISSMSDRVKLEKFSKICKSSSLWIVGVIFAVFLGILEIEGSLSTSVDSVTIKATETAVSNIVPVMGKFVSDSIEVVMGSTEVIGKTIGILGILSIFLVCLIPIIKLIIYSIIYYLLSAFSEMLNIDQKITKLMENVSSLFKTLIGITVSISITFVISISIIINLIGKVYN